MQAYHKKLKDKGIIQSMYRTGNCLDNCVMENFFGKLKNEKYLTSIVEENDKFENVLGCVSTKLLDCDYANGRFAISHRGELFGCLSYTEMCEYPLIDGFEKIL